MSDHLNFKWQDFQITPMTTTDLKQVVSLAAAANLSNWSLADFESEMVNPISLLFVAARENKILGFIFARLITPEVEIFNLVVLPEVRRRGVGKELLQKIIQVTYEAEFTQCWLEVRESNYSARNFYLSRGFKVVGRRRNYYANPFEDAILMALVYSKDNPKK